MQGSLPIRFDLCGPEFNTLEWSLQHVKIIMQPNRGQMAKLILLQRLQLWLQLKRAQI